jgi:Leucine-rich repeat (LRR) protein
MKLPEEIGNLHNLQRLKLDNNQIQRLPKEIRKLYNLKLFHLQHNIIRKLPKELVHMKDIIKLY